MELKPCPFCGGTRVEVFNRLQEILPPEAFLPWDERMTKAIRG